MRLRGGNRLTLRIGLILSGVLTGILGVAAFSVHYVAGIVHSPMQQQPLEAQLAAVVELIETSPPERQDLVLRALQSGDYSVSLRDTAPPPQGAYLPMVTRVLRNAIHSEPPHEVRAEIPSSDDGSPRRLRVLVRLHDGRTLIIEREGRIIGYLLGIRIATLGLFGVFAIGGLALWLLRSQLRPLETMVRAVESFGSTLAPAPVPKRGADEIRRLVDAFNAMQTRIRGLLESRTRMFAAISHDLGTYLTRLHLRSEWISDPQQRERAVRDLQEMEALMRDTLTLAALDGDIGHGETLDLATVISEQVESFHSAGVPVQWKPSAAAPIRGHRQALARLLSNLISNALKHAGSAEVSVLQPSNAAIVELRVEDRGPGIPAELRELVLEPFYRGDCARNLDDGNFGLGLAIVADIVRRHQATLILDDRPGGGLRVRVRFARADGDEPAGKT